MFFVRFQVRFEVVFSDRFIRTVRALVTFLAGVNSKIFYYTGCSIFVKKKGDNVKTKKSRGPTSCGVGSGKAV